MNRYSPDFLPVTLKPGALMGPALRERLKERAGLTFSAR